MLDWHEGSFSGESKPTSMCRYRALWKSFSDCLRAIRVAHREGTEGSVGQALQDCLSLGSLNGVAMEGPLTHAQFASMSTPNPHNGLVGPRLTGAVGREPEFFDHPSSGTSWLGVRLVGKGVEHIEYVLRRWALAQREVRHSGRLAVLVAVSNSALARAEYMWLAKVPFRSVVDVKFALVPNATVLERFIASHFGSRDVDGDAVSSLQSS
jgi:hypothetical protein